MTYQSISYKNAIKEVNEFFGFSLKKCIDKYHRKLVKSELSNNETESDELNAIIAYLMDMRILHKHALLDETYVENCYALSDQMYNEGGYSLISPSYFPFGKSLIRNICEVVNQDLSDNKRNNAYNYCIKI